MEGVQVVEVRNKIDHMAYLPGMEQIDPAVREQVIAAMEAYDPMAYTARDVRAALEDKAGALCRAAVACGRAVSRGNGGKGTAGKAPLFRR